MSARASVDERLFALVLALVATDRGLTKAEILSSVHGYSEDYREGGDNSALERKFERDKDEIRELGIPLETREPGNESGNNQLTRYLIPKSAYELPQDVRFSAEELGLLTLAAEVWKEGSLSAESRRAIIKLRSLGVAPDDPLLGYAPRVSTHDRAFAPLSQALEKGVVVQFRYLRPGGAEAAQRTIAPLALYQFRGRWYLTGTSAADGGERTYLLSRIVGPVTLTKQPAPRAPADAAQRYLRELEGIWLANEAVVDVVPGSDAAVRLGHRYGTAEGATRLEPHYADVHVLADELAGYGPEALVVEPAALRDAVLERLRRARALHESVLDQGRPPVGGPAPHGGAPDRHAVRGTTPDRLTLLLSLVPYLMATKVVSVAEVAEHFDLDVDEVRRAVELIAVSGIPGSTRAYDPGDLFDIDWEAFEDEDVIVLTHGVAIDDSPRLSAREAAVLITGLQLLQALPENDPAAIDALKAKLARGATEAPAPVAIAAVESDETLATIAAIRRAIAERTQLAFDYLDGEGNREHRSVDPLRLESSDDTWYLRAWCHLREGIRTFRLDRISGLAATGEPIGESAVEASLPDSLFEASPDDLTVELRIAEAALPFVADYLGAVPATPDGDGWLRADIRVAHFHGLKRIATGNAGLIEVLSPPAARDEVVAWADAAIRAYEAPHRPGGG